MQTATPRAQIINREGTLLGMFGREGMAKFAPAAYDAIRLSFQEQKMNNPTQGEVRRRFEICVKWAKIMRGDLQWGIDRVCDNLKHPLRAELLGQEYKPDTRSCWMPGDGS
jgi:hypothetical protein